MFNGSGVVIAQCVCKERQMQVMRGRSMVKHRVEVALHHLRATVIYFFFILCFVLRRRHTFSRLVCVV